MLKKWDIITIIFLICLSFIPELVFGVVMNKHYNGVCAEVTIDGKLYGTISLSEHRGDEQINIITPYGYNTIEVKDKSIKIIDADCKDKICMRSEYISEPGQMIVCLPHKLIIEIRSTDVIPDSLRC
ncbi:NusG domain II-containing protein [Clostridium sp.]|uniref:NusG domain II-containing protein n=1 Tax=Clostridium sp. TaxID=1506 RepID=UPI002607EEB9|nr:NusG domain II-containing protein [Clostridium sp.]